MGEWPPDGGAESGSPGAGQVSGSLEAVTLNPEDTVPGREHSPHLCHCQWVKVQAIKVTLGNGKQMFNICGTS